MNPPRRPASGGRNGERSSKIDVYDDGEVDGRGGVGDGAAATKDAGRGETAAMGRLGALAAAREQGAAASSVGSGAASMSTGAAATGGGAASAVLPSGSGDVHLSSFPRSPTIEATGYHGAVETVSYEGGGKNKDGTAMDVDMTSHGNSINDCTSKGEALISHSSPYCIINPDPTPKKMNSIFYSIYPRLLPILQEDDEKQFLCFFKKAYRMMTCDFITPQTLLHMILEDSVRCAKVVLEGQAPELNGYRAYPNCATQYGFYPLHQAAEIFSVDMIKVLLQHGASANVLTCGDRVINGLLPLHVAVENTCMHKYIEDNLCGHELYRYYWKADTKEMYKLIHLLCLPEMKIFLDTTRLLAEHTNDLLGVICTYIRSGKLVQTAVLVLAAQEHIRVSCCCKKNADCKPDGFSYIIRYIAENMDTIKLNKCNNEKDQQQLSQKYISSILWFVEAISVAGESLGAYIGEHSKAPHEEILQCVSSILKFYGFCPTGESISVRSLKLSAYNLPLPDGVIRDGHGYALASEVAAGTLPARASKIKAMNKKPTIPRGFDLKFRRKSFFPFWCSALAIGFPVKICPSYVYEDYQINPKPISPSSVMDKEPSPISTHCKCLSASMLQSVSRYQLKRTFGTAAFSSNCQSTRLFATAALTRSYQSKRLFATTAFALLKVLKKVRGIP